ncbi:MAG: EthD domain-containing protein [Chloroflexi bacterium]|nr:EthD domain-containing protein [Chloroflexota bacterium]
MNMVKAVALLKRKPGISWEEFIEHYEKVHAPLILKHSTGVIKYVRNFVVSDGITEPDFDCITELWYEDMEAFQSTISVWETEAGDVIIDDEETFLDRSKIEFFLVDERLSTL